MAKKAKPAFDPKVFLATVQEGRSIVCQEKDRDRYGRVVAILASVEEFHKVMEELACESVKVD